MGLKRNGNTIINTDSAGYLAAKKRLEMTLEQKKRNSQNDTLEHRVSLLEAQILELQKEINQILKQ